MTDRPEGALAPDHPLLEAVRYNDADSEERGLEGALNKIGLSLDDVMYVAKQRAMRLVLIQHGRGDELKNLTEPRVIPMTEAEQRTMNALVPLYIDAVALGWRARELHEGSRDVPSGD